ncbi:hypothetical protein FRC12_010398 [Ceratobasidium sp. 428]|nr:hypothetical protein FRC12_010398 [Ceratobasidium sp. 428]
MRVLLAVAAAAAAQLATAVVDIHSVPHQSTANVVPGSYIIQLKQGSNHLKRGFASPHEELYHDLRARGASWETTKEFTDPLFTGAVIKIGGGPSGLQKLVQVASNLGGSNVEVRTILLSAERAG